MKLGIFFIVIIIFGAGLFSNPVFVVASNTCYVDADADDDGNGDNDKPYKKIKKALDKNCKEIIVKKGTYKDDIVLKEDVELDGKNKDKIIITGNITMENGSEISDVTISGHGVNVTEGANVKIEDATIKNAHIGIKTVGNGKLTVENVALYKNRKGMYLQKGKNIKIINSEVYDNDEEGIDIRANVDGIISNNLIYNNGEGGIEVIVGKSDLKIYKNKIRKNGASGIATQFYKEASKLGNIVIKDNIITSNKDFGVTCKVPSGGSFEVKYWTKSIQMFANKISNNKDGDFSNDCFFDDTKISDAIKSKKQKKQEQKLEKLEQEEEQKKQEQKEKELQETELKQEKLEQEEEQKKQNQELLRNKLQKEKDLQNNVDLLRKKVNNFYKADNTSQNKIKNRPNIIMFFIGPNYKELRNMAERVERYDTKIQEAQKIQDSITDEMTKKEAQKNIIVMTQQKEEIYDFIKEYNHRFSLFGWFFRKNTIKTP